MAAAATSTAMKTSKSMIAGWGLMSEAIDIPDGACNVTVLGIRRTSRAVL
jgi:hypothetical protein